MLVELSLCTPPPHLGRKNKESQKSENITCDVNFLCDVRWQ